MSMQSIRDYYRVPAKRGMRVTFMGNPGIITGSHRTKMYLRLRIYDGQMVWVHPTWRMEYQP